MRLPRLEAILLSAFLGCASPNPVPRFETQQARTVAHDNYCALYLLVRRAQDEGMERGGVIVIQGDNPCFVEIENAVCQDKLLFDAYVQGNFNNYNVLSAHADMAACGRSRADQLNANHFNVEAAVIKTQLLPLPYLPIEQRITQSANLWSRYDSLVLHNIYCMNHEQLSQVEGTVVAVVHTHDSTPPSLQDEDLSRTMMQIVVRLDPDNSCIIYKVSEGQSERILETRQDVAMR